MNKKNLYYIIEEKTNMRYRTSSTEIWIGEKEKAYEKSVILDRLYDTKYEPMSIEEYEKKFIEDKVVVLNEMLSKIIDRVDNLEKELKRLRNSYNAVVENYHLE